VSNTIQDLRVIALDLHASATTVAKLTPAQLVVDEVLVYSHARRQAFDNRDECASV
jgi:methylase of polypeptide subunit release factors